MTRLATVRFDGWTCPVHGIVSLVAAAFEADVTGLLWHTALPLVSPGQLAADHAFLNWRFL